MDDRINNEYVGPPGKTVEPTVEGIDLFEVEDFRKKKKNESNDPVN